MITCPYCKKEINYLRNHTPIIAEYLFTITPGKEFPDGVHYESTGEVWYETPVGLDATEFNEYLCPECGVVISKTERDAVGFLTNRSASEIELGMII